MPILVRPATVTRAGSSMSRGSRSACWGGWVSHGMSRCRRQVLLHWRPVSASHDISANAGAPMSLIESFYSVGSQLFEMSLRYADVAVHQLQSVLLTAVLIAAFTFVEIIRPASE